MMQGVTRAIRGIGLGLLAAGVFAVACKEGPRDGAEGGLTPTPVPSASPFATPEPLLVNSSALGAVTEPGARNLYAMAIASAGTVITVDVDAQTLDSASALDGRLTILGPTGAQLASADDGKTVDDPHAMHDPFVAFTAGQIGTYTVALEDAAGNGGPAGYDYVLRAKSVAPQPMAGGDSCATATLLTNLNVSLSGTTTGFTDHCCGAQVLPCTGSAVGGPDAIYKAILSSGMSFEAVRTGLAFDGAVYVATTCGNAAEIASVCARGGDGRDDADGIVFRPAVTGTYYLFVDGVTAAGANAGAYQLHLRSF